METSLAPRKSPLQRSCISYLLCLSIETKLRENPNRLRELTMTICVGQCSKFVRIKLV